MADFMSMIGPLSGLAGVATAAVAIITLGRNRTTSELTNGERMGSILTRLDGMERSMDRLRQETRDALARFETKIEGCQEYHRDKLDHVEGLALGANRMTVSGRGG